MSYLDRKEQKKVAKKGFLPIVGEVSLKFDTVIAPHEPEPTQKVGFHFNIQEVLTSKKEGTHKTIPINVLHIEIPRIEGFEKPRKVDDSSRFKKAFDQAFNPLWTSEKEEPKAVPDIEKMREQALQMYKKAIFKEFPSQKEQPKYTLTQVMAGFLKGKHEPKLEPVPIEKKSVSLPYSPTESFRTRFEKEIFGPYRGEIAMPEKKKPTLPYAPPVETYEPKPTHSVPDVPIRRAFSIAEQIAEKQRYGQLKYEVEDMPIAQAFKFAEAKRKEEEEEDKEEEFRRWLAEYERERIAWGGFGGGIGLRRGPYGLPTVRRGVYG